MSGNYQSDRLSWKFDVLKTSIFAIDASLFWQTLVLGTSNCHEGTISR